MSDEEKQVEGEKGFVLPEPPEAEESSVKEEKEIIRASYVLPPPEEPEVQLPEEEPPEKEA